MDKEKFILELKELGIKPDESKIKLLNIYFNELLKYNEHTNLTTITSEKDVYYKHFYDSLSLVKIIDLDNQNTLLDIGSGAGFPGVVLKIFYPHLNVILLDSNNKKTKFLNYIIDILNLQNISVVNDRVENFSKDHLNYFDIVTARAVSNLPVLTELALPLVRKDKYFIALKGNADEELKESVYAVEYMKAKVDSKISFELPYDYGTRTLIKIKKVKETSQNELRPYDKIIKKPLQKKSK